MPAISIGNFDGVHLGHQALIARAGSGMTAVTFDPTPQDVLGLPVPARIMSSRRRDHFLRAAGAGHVLTLATDRATLGLAPEEFLRWLRDRVPFGRIVEGPDFRFGHRRSGDVTTLQDLGPKVGFMVEVVPEVEASLHSGHVVAARSTTVRWMIQHGRVADAERLLGRPHELVGTVEQGDQRGRTIGFPTANLACDGCLLPADGVYAATAHLDDGRAFIAAVSVGIKLTFSGARRTIEAHLLGFDGTVGEYGWPLRLELRRWVRDQVRFTTVDDLIRQIGADTERCREELHA
jgi:riboflavin kinase/FMN adenylyltransferase